ncbi:MAG TPA: hypothetical protein VMD91_15585 [Candidatus Sulfotelmatobacter sp.]|nr:hypothetical protein [Candidatus Sulfotelmatobacter sp.]
MLVLTRAQVSDPIIRSTIGAAEYAIKCGADPNEVDGFLKELIESPPPVELDLAPVASRVDVFAKGLTSAGQPVLPPPERRTPIDMGSGAEFEWWQDAIIGGAAMAVPPLGVAINASRAVTAATNRTVGIGVAVTFAAAVGASLGTGLLITNLGKLGWYGSVSGLLGFIASVSAVVQITIVGGGVEKFGGTSYGVGAMGGEILVGGITALIDAGGKFMGISVSGGIGVGIPFEVFGQIQHTWTQV